MEAFFQSLDANGDRVLTFEEFSHVGKKMAAQAAGGDAGGAAAAALPPGSTPALPPA